MEDDRKRGTKDISKVSLLGKWDSNYCCVEDLEEQLEV